MHAMTAEPGPQFTARANRSGLDERLRNAVTQVLDGLNSQTVVRERRRDKRFPFPHPISLTPVDEHGQALCETFVVLGKHLSEGGLDFYHEEPLTHRRAIASIETRPGQWVNLMLVLTRCRFTRHGWYENGGRFVDVVNTPIVSPAFRSRTA
ncbi:MAG: hypothetical protein RIC55_32520 [Pirellulaceae bacterium]